jgi:hypothetical protein
VVLYGRETWSLTLGENVDGGCLRAGCRGEYSDLGEVHNEELLDTCSSPRMNRLIMSGRKIWTGHVARIGEADRDH